MLTRRTGVRNCIPPQAKELFYFGRRISSATMTEKSENQGFVTSDCSLPRPITLNSHPKTIQCGSVPVMTHLKAMFWIRSCCNRDRKVKSDCLCCLHFLHKLLTICWLICLEWDLKNRRKFLRTKTYIFRSFWKRNRFLHKKVHIVPFLFFVGSAKNPKLVLGLTSPPNVAAHKRFVSRQGSRAILFSDIGSSASGSETEALHQIF